MGNVKQIRNSSLVFLIQLLWPLLAFTQTNLYVSPKGSNAAKGTLSKPFATLQKAVAASRSIHGSVVIYLAGGTYRLNKPVVFLAADARKVNQALIITNIKNQLAIISGAALLQHLNWKPYKNGIWQTTIQQDLIFDALYVNGQLQRMARYPNFDSSAHFLGGTAADAVSKERAANWLSPAGGYVHALHRSEWGDFHYLITGKNEQNELALEGGWQNNRRMGMHDKHRFVENIFEELDTADEWYYNKETKTLYYYPSSDIDLNTATFETSQIAHLFEFKGSEQAPISNITISGLTLTQTLRTFMQNKEPLLRSDWTIYRGGAVLFDGSENCKLKNCTLTNLGGNAVFFNKYNRNDEVSGCLIKNIGASAVCFVGDPNAVRSPSFEYNEFVPLAQIDRTPGPKTNNFPADCKVYDNLMFDLGQVEKQSAGVELSMCQSITIAHNAIYDVPRAGINVSEGTWGGHIIEYNDVFNTVKESGDHGSFNSWGRDRYWHPNKRLLDSIVATNYDLALLDVVKPIIIRNNRWRCDHGWDIDLDDGSSNYRIYNNLCLNGGIKLREGVNRVVENNIMVNNTFHPHVWFANSNDVFRRNVVSSPYLPIGITVWGKETDYNFFPDSASLKAAWGRGTDQNSVCGNLQFVDPKNGDFRLKKGSVAFTTGFKNFTMDSFGVISPRLKTLAKKPPLPNVLVSDSVDDNNMIDFMGTKLKNLTTLGERSATGMDEIRGVLVVELTQGSGAITYLQPNDVILSLNGVKVNNLQDLLQARRSVIGSGTEMVIFRNQKEMKMHVEFNGK